MHVGRKQLCFGEGVVPVTPGCIHACMHGAIAPRMHAVMQPGATGLKPYPQSQILASDMKCMLSGMAGRFYYTCKARSKPLPL
jgi:hypothetical protein